MRGPGRSRRRFFPTARDRAAFGPRDHARRACGVHGCLRAARGRAVGPGPGIARVLRARCARARRASRGCHGRARVVLRNVVCRKGMCWAWVLVSSCAVSGSVWCAAGRVRVRGLRAGPVGSAASRGVYVYGLRGDREFEGLQHNCPDGLSAKRLLACAVGKIVQIR